MFVSRIAWIGWVGVSVQLEGGREREGGRGRVTMLSLTVRASASWVLAGNRGIAKVVKGVVGVRRTLGWRQISGWSKGGGGPSRPSRVVWWLSAEKPPESRPQPRIFGATPPQEPQLFFVSSYFLGRWTQHRHRHRHRHGAAKRLGEER